jgi:hypothetical protein
MTYRVVYDVRDQAGWFLLDSWLLIALGGVVSVCLFAFAVDGWRTPSVEPPPERVGRFMVRLGAAGCIVCAGLLVAWAVGYGLGGPVSFPLGRLAWLFLSGIILFAGRHTLRHPTPNPPRAVSTRQRVGLLLGSAGVAAGVAVSAWLGYAKLWEQQDALNSGDVSVVEGEVTAVYRVKQGPRVKVAGQTFHLEGRPVGHLGREVWLRPGMQVRVTHRGGTVLRFEVASDTEPDAAPDPARKAGPGR